MTRYGIYEVEDWPEQNGGKWGGYRVAATASVDEQGWGKLYPKSDDKNHYKDQDEKPKKSSSEDLEI